MKRRLLAASLLLASVGRPALAQTAPAGQVETDPIRCWWKTDRTAIRIGERFTLALTCGVVETSSVKVVPTLTQIDPGAIQLTPFEVVGGRRGDDVVAPPWRYVQYEYTLRLLGEGFFGQDVSIPPLTVTYNVQAAAGQGAEGRDQQYVLPPLPMRVLSIVPQSAADIRDASRDSFAAIESRRFRATTAQVGAGVAFALAALLAVFAGLRMTGRVRARKSAAARPIATPFVLAGCLRSLSDVKAEVMRDGWSPALARRALAALRVAGAVAVGHDVAQTAAAGDAQMPDGQVVVRRGLVRRRSAAVSAAITPASLTRALGSGHVASRAARVAATQLESPLQAFSTAGYGRTTELDRLTLDTALDQGTDAIRKLRRASFWPAFRGLQRQPPAPIATVARQ
jgi:hypothetical protein